MMFDEYLGCGSSSCKIQKPKGQATNGGCRCLYYLQTKERIRIEKYLYREKNKICKNCFYYRNDTETFKDKFVCHKIDSSYSQDDMGFFLPPRETFSCDEFKWKNNGEDK